MQYTNYSLPRKNKKNKKNKKNNKNNKNKKIIKIKKQQERKNFSHTENLKFILDINSVNINF